MVQVVVAKFKIIVEIGTIDRRTELSRSPEALQPLSQTGLDYHKMNVTETRVDEGIGSGTQGSSRDKKLNVGTPKIFAARMEGLRPAL
ncbi:hypothetical protein C5167_026926 [Papaver somniferum]|nr:hypothetical protein C5167_026926 [Papaver somniferum]